nr:PREDICTED: uncharacterized protein C7orf43 homolog [Latimeria chalumnae]|eukprot:XP_014353529.1 PREDICTED: uncharacterized protein C7orf43 homolog [Latimeria chalumnae]
MGDFTAFGSAVKPNEKGEGDGESRAQALRGFRECRPLLTHNSPGKPEQQIIVTVWKRDTEKAEIREHGYLRILQHRAPSQIFREDQSSFKAQVSTLLTVLPPPTVKCRQVNVSGKYLTVLKVLNTSSQEEISVRDIRILPNFNTSYLPVMPDGSVLLVDSVCHQSGDVSMASFYRMDSVSCRLPSMLSALEEQNFLFQLQVNEGPQQDTKEVRRPPPATQYRCFFGGGGWHLSVQESLEKKYWNFLAVLTFSFPYIRLPSIRLDRPCFVMMASCDSPVQVQKRFNVQYTVLNNLQDFLAVRLVWTPENAFTGEGERENGLYRDQVCGVTFSRLFLSLPQLSQHMKLKLQFSASVSIPPPDARPVSRKNSPSSPAVRDLVERHQANLGRSQSFSHQQPSRSHLMRSGSVMERRAITPPVGSPIGRPLYLPPEKAVLSLDKIAKRECKVLVVDPVT